MIDSVFLANDVSAGPVILGLRLRPLSIWHSWALKAAANPFSIGGEYGIEDICNALLICTLTKHQHDELAGLGALGLYKGEQIAPPLISATTEERAEALRLFLDYFDDCTQFPDFWQDGKADPVKDRVRCPREWHLVASLMRMNICRTEPEAWDYPIAKAQCWMAVEGERNGSKSYVDERDRADIERANKLKEQHANG
jgi:hypothetical protein